MDLKTLTDISGYIAMTLLVISFIPKQIKTIRYINLIACLFFIVYGILLGWAWPIIISNLAVSSIQFYYLFIAPKNKK
ncbi:MAG: hypothetical protein ACK5L7_05625 [Paludibacteraceae bacterium]